MIYPTARTLETRLIWNPDTSEYHDGQSHHAAQLDTPFSRADVNKALFEARLQNLFDTELKYPWESGVMGDIFLDQVMLWLYLDCLRNI